MLSALSNSSWKRTTSSFHWRQPAPTCCNKFHRTRGCTWSTELNRWTRTRAAQFLELLPIWSLSSWHLGWIVDHHHLWGRMSSINKSLEKAWNLGTDQGRSPGPRCNCGGSWASWWECRFRPRWTECRSLGIFPWQSYDQGTLFALLGPQLQ